MKIMFLVGIVNAADENNSWFFLYKLNKYTEITSIIEIEIKGAE